MDQKLLDGEVNHDVSFGLKLLKSENWSSVRSHFEVYRHLNLGRCRKRVIGFGFTESFYSPPVVSRNSFMTKRPLGT